MSNSHTWHIEQLGNGLMAGEEYKRDGIYGAEEIRRELNNYISTLPDDSSRIHRDELSEIDYAIGDALDLIRMRNYSVTQDPLQRRQALYLLHFIECKIEELLNA